MKTLKDVMSADVVWISPAQQVKSAIILLKGHGIDALPVVYAHDSVVGMLYCSSLLGQSPDSSIMDVMDKNYTAVPSDTPVFQAAEMMKVGGNSHLLIVDSGKLVGIVSRSDIVAELGQSYDTLTKLPWRDAFREWGISALDHGFEISVILIDMNSFGRFNKKYGHVMGDNVLKSVAEVLSSSVDPAKDFLCRYAGDEFSIASYRKATDATEFGRQLMEKISQIEIPGLPEKIGATFGMAGGRRSGGREQVHSAAMLDDLITNASLNCTASKPVKPEEAAKPAPAELQTAQPAPAVQPAAAPVQTVTPRAQQTRLKIQTIRLSTSPAETTVQVLLSLGDAEFSHSVTGYSTGGRSLLRLVAEATASAASKSLPADHGIMIDDVITFKAGDDREVVSVIATLITPRNSSTCAGSAVVKHADPYRAAAAALLSATNRQLSLLPKEGTGNRE
ncbi:MAG: CBS domain-containing protein [Armatimonadota bacterium]